MPVSSTMNKCTLFYYLTSRTSSQWRMVNSLLLATVARFGFVVVSYGCQVPAGIFIPSMAVGATFGRMIGIMVKALVKLVAISLLLSLFNIQLLAHFQMPPYFQSANRMCRASLLEHMPSWVLLLLSGM